ncbi:MAG TPA: septal ring lytic transglycosylase RlpA family protein [Acetobacteraceae bacterium]|jgi:rare lipoprotein A|nr:septal ring lytic transglycosylase RlpA family protein [Acetobacteraceae bacterium]
MVWFGRITATALTAICAGAAWASPTPGPEAHQEATRLAQLPPIVPHGRQIDHSGRAQTGRASYYAHHFDNRKMANGKRFHPNTNVAASKNLPLGTTARVTNLNNGKSATVHVEDRGPFVDGRVVDVTPKVAGELDIREAGVAPVVVAPIAVPQKNGEVKLGAGAADASPQEVATATQEAEVR